MGPLAVGVARPAPGGTVAAAPSAPRGPAAQASGPAGADRSPAAPRAAGAV